jgi:hypothetical protein
MEDKVTEKEVVQDGPKEVTIDIKDDSENGGAGNGSGQSKTNPP